jgi:predicted negative regulator of RcsB-dependent stress response
VEVYRTDEQQIESLRAWWKENGTSIIFGVALGVAGIFGWRWWQEYETAQAEAASGLFEQMTTASRQSDNKAAESLATRLVEEFPSTGYAVLAKLYQARRSVDAGDLDAAAAHLQWALEQDPDSWLKLELALNLARVRTAQEKYDEALALISVPDAGEFSASYDELRGDIEILRGNHAAARTAYERAVAASRAKRLDTAILELKLDNLGLASSS